MPDVAIPKEMQQRVAIARAIVNQPTGCAAKEFVASSTTRKAPSKRGPLLIISPESGGRSCPAGS